MKTRREHVVPLPRQAVAILKELQLFTGTEGFLFPCIRDARRSLSESSLSAALRRMGNTAATTIPLRIPLAHSGWARASLDAGRV
jgi:hypothetical protein